MNNMKFLHARYYNSDRDVIESIWLDNDQNQVPMHARVSNDDPIWVEVLENTTIEEIEKNTVEYVKNERAAFVSVVKQIATAEGLLVKENTSEKLTLFEMIKVIESDSEEMFKLKLEVFERPEVKSSTNRTWKAKMRKSTSVLELLSLLHTGPGGQENVPTESQG